MPAGAALISVEEYLSTDYDPRCEYIDGVLRQKTMSARKHARMEFRLCTLIEALQMGFEPAPEETVRIRPGKYLVPDVSVQLTSDLQDPYPVRPVHLCVEVMSPDDRFADVVSKCGEYHAWGVKYCWIVDPDDKRCWQYDSGGRPNEVPVDGSIEAGPIILSHADIFESV